MSNHEETSKSLSEIFNTLIHLPDIPTTIVEALSRQNDSQYYSLGSVSQTEAITTSSHSEVAVYSPTSENNYHLLSHALQRSDALKAVDASASIYDSATQRKLNDVGNCFGSYEGGSNYYKLQTFSKFLASQVQQQYCHNYNNSEQTATNATSNAPKDTAHNSNASAHLNSTSTRSSWFSQPTELADGGVNSSLSLSERELHSLPDRLKRESISNESSFPDDRFRGQMSMPAVSVVPIIPAGPQMSFARHQQHSTTSNPISFAQSMPNSPHLMKRSSMGNGSQALETSKGIDCTMKPKSLKVSRDADEHFGITTINTWPHFSHLTEYLDVHQVNNYSQDVPEVNWHSF